MPYWMSFHSLLDEFPFPMGLVSIPHGMGPIPHGMGPILGRCGDSGSEAGPEERSGKPESHRNPFPGLCPRGLLLKAAPLPLRARPSLLDWSRHKKFIGA